jgi:hypothetical protein
VPDVTFPEDAVRCSVGDHLIQHDGGTWRVYGVEDYVALSRLVVLMRGDEPDQLLPELPEGVGPAYPGPHLLLSAYPTRFDSREAAEAALGDLGEAMERVCRALSEFPAATTQVVRGATDP